jgi:hypothetical protein
VIAEVIDDKIMMVNPKKLTVASKPLTKTTPAKEIPKKIHWMNYIFSPINITVKRATIKGAV